MIDFLIENWKWLSAIALGIIELILMLVFKRRPQINYRGLLNSICDWILEAEKLFKVGSDKMSYVLGRAKVYLGDMYNENDVRCIVEYVLTLPEKKNK